MPRPAPQDENIDSRSARRRLIGTAIFISSRFVTPSIDGVTDLKSS